jgi:predicted GNAT family acetyltransferase
MPERPRVEVERLASVGAFLTAAAEFLAPREAEHNLIYGICAGLEAQPEAYDRPPDLLLVRREGRVVLAAVRTPPRQLVLSEVDDPAALDALAEELADADLSGVVGPSEHVPRFAGRWASLAGGTASVWLRERIFQLTKVRPPRPVAGHLRVASHEDRPLVTSWLEAFELEALGEPPGEDLPRIVDRWLAGRGRALYLWLDGKPVSLCGTSGTTPNGIRIGPVYTPPAERARGYASACVAAVSQAQLDAGRRFCFLFTDLANPTSNHIYQEIGYASVRDVDAYLFEAAG